MEPWPALPLSGWQPTRDTVHLWTQIVGKTRLALAAPANHWWNVALYVTSSGLTTSLMPDGDRGVEVSFDFVDHALDIRTTTGAHRRMALEPRSVADFFAEYQARLAEVGVDVALNPMPVELPDVVPFDRDDVHDAYDPAAMRAFWTSLVSVDRVFNDFRAEFRGKASPVHFFWGAFDLAVTRFSGRPAPRHPGGVPNCPDRVMWEAYSDEVSSAGYWPGGAGEGAFYSYAYPEPDGYRDQEVGPDARYDPDLGEFVLPYTTVRTAADPDATLLDFLHRTYRAATTSGRWP
ncbi:DUF5996 family protein [Asanoa siamensis]|uniref:Ava_C0101 and related proteins n=1 Tax=Asanoa siamensis TaxID=926357 RepID=A0ABQ4CM85_9ACTN|nr:DUF5996 family protein [Asanoa siamensis]GIF72408.1 hypothetical protein Asi02nite_19260 [Asanoa siamensis]